MSISSILLVLFIVFIVWPLIKFIWAIRKAHMQARRAFEEATGTKWNQRNEARNTPVKEKIFDRNVGEYVEFEEIEHTSNNTGTQPNTSNPQPKIEQQIVDAEWEDIK